MTLKTKLLIISVTSICIKIGGSNTITHVTLNTINSVVVTRVGQLLMLSSPRSVRLPLPQCSWRVKDKDKIQQSESCDIGYGYYLVGG